MWSPAIKDADGSGFTLMEVLVAMLVTAASTVIFFQIVSAGMRLELKSWNRLEQAVKVGQIFDGLMLEDIQADDFKWDNEQETESWHLDIEEVETMDLPEDPANPVTLDFELYRIIFKFQAHDGTAWTLIRYVSHSPGFFSEDFKRVHLQ